MIVSWGGQLVLTSVRSKVDVLTPDSTPVSTKQLLSVLTSDSCVLTLDAFISQMYSLQANLMQSSHFSILDVSCTSQAGRPKISLFCARRLFLIMHTSFAPNNWWGMLVYAPG